MEFEHATPYEVTVFQSVPVRPGAAPLLLPGLRQQLLKVTLNTIKGITAGITRGREQVRCCEPALRSSNPKRLCSTTLWETA
ncbi:MAG: hypothetical protein M1118_04360 [Chloroflexi bacterium]|nr:hypothetical protein [Chloroflexota bacterium]